MHSATSAWAQRKAHVERNHSVSAVSALFETQHKLLVRCRTANERQNPSENVQTTFLARSCNSGRWIEIALRLQGPQFVLDDSHLQECRLRANTLPPIAELGTLHWRMSTCESKCHS